MELVQKGNQYMKGKSEAFASFRDILAEEIVKGIPELKDDVTKVLEGREAAAPNAAPKQENGDTKMS